MQLSAAFRKLQAAFRHPPPPEGSERVWIVLEIVFDEVKRV